MGGKELGEKRNINHAEDSHNPDSLTLRDAVVSYHMEHLGSIFSSVEVDDDPASTNFSSNPIIVELRPFVSGPLYREGHRRPIITFYQPEDAGVNDVTTGAVIAALQGGKPMNIFLPSDTRPFKYNILLHTGIRSYITHGAEEFRQADWTNDSKLEYMCKIGRIFNEACRINPNAFWVAAGDKANFTDSRRFGLFTDFFSQFSKRLQTSIRLNTIHEVPELKHRYTGLGSAVEILSRSATSANIYNVIQEYTKNEINLNPNSDTEYPSIRHHMLLAYQLLKIANPNYTPQSRDELMELSVLTNQNEDTIQFFKSSPSSLLLGQEIDWTMPQNDIAHALLHDVHSLYKQRRKKDLLNSIDIPNPEHYGLVIDHQRTNLLRAHYEDKGATVVTMDSIRNNHVGFHLYQRALAISIAKSLGFHVATAEKSSNKKFELKTQVSKEHVDIIKQKSDWLWLLLDNRIFDEWLKRMPYQGVPPFVFLKDEPVPIHTLQIKTDHDLEIINDFPVLNHPRWIRTRNRSKSEKQLKADLAIPGYFVSLVHDNGGLAFIDHAIARITAKGDVISENEFAPEFDETPVNIDCDVLLFNVSDPGLIAGLTAQKINSLGLQSHRFSLYSGGMMLGLTMGAGIGYGYVAKPYANMSRSGDPYKVAHGDHCVIQGVGAWAGKDTDHSTSSLLEAMTALSGFRSIGIVPIRFKSGQDKRGNPKFQFAYKFIAPIGFHDFAEAGGGVLVGGNVRNIIRFLSLKDAFPLQFQNNSRGAMNIWHIIRTINDLLAYSGGVLYPEGITLETELIDNNTNDMILQGSSQFREIVIRASSYIQQVVQQYAHSNQFLQIDDLRYELESGAKDAMSADPYHFLVLSSDANYGGPERGLYGVELSKLYPHIDLFRKNPTLWDKLLHKVKYEDRLVDEDGAHFIARQLMEIPGIIEIISDTLMKEFLIAPSEMYKRLLSQKTDNDQNIAENREWMYLNPQLWGLFRQKSGVWISLINHIKERNIHFKKWDDVVNIMNSDTSLSSSSGRTKRKSIRRIVGKYSQEYGKKYSYMWNSLIDKSTEIAEDEYKQLKQGYTRALADWISNPGF